MREREQYRQIELY